MKFAIRVNYTVPPGAYPVTGQRIVGETYTFDHTRPWRLRRQAESISAALLAAFSGRA